MMRSRTPSTRLVGDAREPDGAVECQAPRAPRRRTGAAARAAAYRLRSSASVAGLAKAATATKVKPPDADDRRALRQRQRAGQRVAVGVPGKAGQEVAAQPLGDRSARAPAPGCGSARASTSSAASASPAAGKQRQAGRQADDGERQQPSEDLGIDQERMADPVETGEEIAEPEPPARRGRRPDAAEPSRRRPVDQPDQRPERSGT